jgi:hypothetical protein
MCWHEFRLAGRFSGLRPKGATYLLIDGCSGAQQLLSVPLA